MLEQLKRVSDLPDLPQVQCSSPVECFEELQVRRVWHDLPLHDTLHHTHDSCVDQRDGSKFVTWRGELYLELHQGTFTTQAVIKNLVR